MENTELKIFRTSTSDIEIEVRLEKETIWLNQYQLEEIFETNRTTITKHISNIYKTSELMKDATCAKFAQVRKEGNRTVKRNISHYNLDIIIAVGYRVNSKKGTEFRIWANKILKDYLIKGYSINNKRLKKQNEKLIELKQTVKLLSNAIEFKQLSDIESRGLLKIIADYSYALEILDQYDYQSLKIVNVSQVKCYKLSYTETKKLIQNVKENYGNSELFGNEKDKSFESSISAIYQTFDEKDLYPSIEEKAANLLYLIVKNHSFSDGNKRIAAFMFLYFLEKNNLLFARAVINGLRTML